MEVYYFKKSKAIRSRHQVMRRIIIIIISNRESVSAKPAGVGDQTGEAKS